MAGDHKCPVCQATFTRPQHVSRHMRSHTGDRPYKCQHCGDQFARSDLLSRHVNKCHPNEKPLVSSIPSRRKGTSSASRATTSKQACDQCVQSTLPCDGANPCAKCLHRKTRCTYVKFHRQTAPLGPGHPARPPHDSSNPAHPPIGALPLGLNPYRLSEPFLLNGSALNPSAISQSPASTNPLYADHQFSFPQPPQVSAPSYDNSFDYTARYRAQADLLSRTGVIPPERGPPLPAIYQESQAPHDPSNAARCAQPYLHNDPHDYPLPPSPSGVDYGYNIDNKSDTYPGNVLDYSTNGYNAHHPLTFNDTQIHQRCESSASDTGSTTSRSQTSSATSSSVHLPLVADYSQHSYSRPATSDGVVQDREGFSSAFGLMSLDDSEVLAGFGETPFFDHAITNGSSSHPSWGDGPTPRANPCDAPPANGKKSAHQQQQQQDFSHGQAGTPASLKELKEMWKQYMKTPFSGQPLAHDHHPAGSPKRERGLSRVASLPSVKTPSAATAGWGDPMRGVNGSLPQPQPQQQANGTNHGGHAAHSRGHNHTDDLRSYEQAVLARRAPLTLHLAPRRRGNTTSTGPPVAHPPPPSATSNTTLPLPGKGNRASPVGSGSGSDRSMSGGSSRASPTSSGGSHGADDPSRPTFKRLPSQTLGPEYAKRAATANMLTGTREAFPGIVGQREQEMQQRGLVGLAERTRRMSFPSGRGGLMG